MVRLVIEQMTACHVRRLHAVFALIIRVSERPAPKISIEPREERLIRASSRALALCRLEKSSYRIWFRGGVTRSPLSNNPIHL